MARKAYPDVPLCLYDFTRPSGTQVAANPVPAAQGGPGRKDAFERARLA